MTERDTSTGNHWLRSFLPVILILLVSVGGLFVLRSFLGDLNESHDHGQEVSIVEGETLPDFKLEPFNDKTVKISSLKSNIFLVNFWATWCEPCLAEMPSLIRLRGRYKDKGLEILPINVDENPEEVLPQALEMFKFPFPVYIDRDQKLGKLFDVHGIPKTIIFDRSRKILFVESGDRNWDSDAVHKKLDLWLQKL